MWRLWMVLWVGLAVPAGAASLSWTLVPDAPRVGDRIDAQLVLSGTDHAPDWDALATDFGSLVSAEAPLTERVNLQQTRHFFLFADLPGSYKLPAVSVPVDGADLHAAARSFVIKGVFNADNPPLPAPNKGALAWPAPWWWQLGYLIPVLLILVGLWWWRRRPVPVIEDPIDTGPPPEPPDRIALARLGELMPGAMPAPLFYHQLSEITRDYLGGVYRLPAACMTSGEVAAALHRLDRSELACVPDWLGEWDRLRFAGRQSEAEAQRRALVAVRSWIDGQGRLPAGGVS